MRPKVCAALLIVQGIFGVHYFVAKVILQHVPPRAWACARVLGAAALLLAFHALFGRRDGPVTRRDWGRLGLYAFFGVAANQWLFAEGLSRTTPSHSALINSLIPVVTLGFALLLGTERVTRSRLAAILVAFASVLVLLRADEFHFDEAWIRGDLLTLANATSFSFFLVISRQYMRRHDPLAATAYMMLFAAIGLTFVGGRDLLQVNAGALPVRLWWLAAYVIVFATAVAYFLNAYALRHVESSLVALFIYLQTPIATLLSMVWLDEHPVARFYVAGAGIFLALFLAVAEERRPQWAFNAPRGRRPVKPES